MAESPSGEVYDVACPHCKKPFEASCFRGDDDRYYCSKLCANEGFNDTIIPIEKGRLIPRVHR